MYTVQCIRVVVVDKYLYTIVIVYFVVVRHEMLVSVKGKDLL